jgi:ABC-type branched-subunit amino acid transport system substrate-binding protein
VTEREADLIPAVAAYAYDAARAVLRAAAAVLPGRITVDGATLTAISARIGSSSFAGITGPVRFDAYGDRRDPSAIVYTVLGERFVPLQVVGGS